MEITLIKNSPVDLSFFKDNLNSLEEVQLVNPSATFPIDENYWMNFFNNGYKTDSLIFQQDGTKIGHVALKQPKKEDSIVFLCFVLVPNEYRGRGLSKIMIKLTEKFLQEEYGVNEYYLNVLEQNNIAMSLYKKIGFNEISRTDDRIRMEKVLS